MKKKEPPLSTALPARERRLAWLELCEQDPKLNPCILLEREHAIDNFTHLGCWDLQFTS